MLIAVCLNCTMKKDEVIDRWFGGGTDLTPYYLFEEDAKHFHQTYKNAMRSILIMNFIPLYKKECDKYFVQSHRNNESRGIGGVFYDHYDQPMKKMQKLFWFQLWQTVEMHL